MAPAKTIGSNSFTMIESPADYGPIVAETAGNRAKLCSPKNLRRLMPSATGEDREGVAEKTLRSNPLQRCTTTSGPT